MFSAHKSVYCSRLTYSTIRYAALVTAGYDVHTKFRKTWLRNTKIEIQDSNFPSPHTEIIEIFNGLRPFLRWVKNVQEHNSVCVCVYVRARARVL
jgi:hypothetical protein